MNNSERIYNIEDTLKYLTEKMDKELRWVKNALKFLIDSDKKEKCKCDNQTNDCTCDYQRMRTAW